MGARDRDPVAARYVLGDVLGEGGMGRVYAARDRVHGRDVAIKMARASCPPSCRAGQPILNEARAVAQLRGEHVVRVLDVGTTGPDDHPYVVMERLTGVDLERLLERDGPFPVETAVGWMRQACEGLAEAHAAGIVHRDVKPANLFLARKGDGSSVIKVLDFGVADFMATADAPDFAGTTHYLAPEVIKGMRGDPRSDVWSLGVVLYELLAGRLPFRGKNIREIWLSVLQERPELLDRAVPGVPRDLGAVVARSLAKEPAARYADAAELAAALRAVEESMRQRARPARGSFASVPGAWIAASTPSVGARGWAAVLAGAMLVLIVSAVARPWGPAIAAPRHGPATLAVHRVGVERIVGHVKRVETNRSKGARER